MCNGGGETHITLAVSAFENGFISANYSTLWDIQGMYGGGVQRFGEYLLPQNKVGTYLILDSDEAQFGGAAEITEISGWEYDDQWGFPDGAGGFFSGHSEESMYSGFSSGFTQP
jgi:hypothetical protein